MKLLLFFLFIYIFLLFSPFFCDWVECAPEGLLPKWNEAQLNSQEKSHHMLK